MLDYRNIRLLTPEERAERAAQLQEQEALERQRILDELDAWDCDQGKKGGRPPIVLPPEIAQRVLNDVRSGLTYRAIARKYANTPWPFSCRWLDRAVKDGRLHQMASDAAFVRQNLAQKGHALTPI